MGAANKVDIAEPLRTEEQLLLLPPLFVKNDAPTEYTYNGYARKDAGNTLAWLPAKKLLTLNFDGAIPDAVEPQVLDSKLQSFCFHNQIN